LPVVPTGGGVVSGHDATRGLVSEILFHRVSIVTRDTCDHEKINKSAVTVLLDHPPLHVRGDMAIVADAPEDLLHVIVPLARAANLPHKAPKVGPHRADRVVVRIHLGLLDFDPGLENRNTIVKDTIEGIHLHRGGGLDDLHVAAAAHGGVLPLPRLPPLVLPGIRAAHYLSPLKVRPDRHVPPLALGVEAVVALATGKAHEEPVLLAREPRTLPG